jgi:kallikrein
MSASFKTVGPNRALRPIAIATILALATFGLSAVGTVEASAIESKGSPRIVGGTGIPISFAPYQVALIDKTASNDFLGQFCGGSILSRQIIVTAAHCFDADFVVANLRILAGSETLSDEAKLANLEVSAVTIHPLWDAAAYAANTSTFENDIAIIQLAVPLTFQADTIEPISLPSQSSVLTANTPAYISGWGYTGVKNDLQQPVDEHGDAFDDNEEPITPVPFPTSLQGVTIYTGSDATCSSEIGAAFKPASMLCAGDFEIIEDPKFMRDTCQGDSGGPMAVDVDEVTTLAGITSWGSGCAWLEPGVYTKVSSYVTWIKTFLANLTSYTAARDAVDEADYTEASWATYEAI